MKRLFLGFIFALFSSASALAACGGTTAQITDSASATRQMALVNDPTGTNCAGVTASDIKYLNGTALASPSAYGTPPTGNVIGVNANVTNTNANGQATMANSSPVAIASNQSANALWGHGATGASVPANATYIGFNSGGNLTGPATATPLPVRPGDGTNQIVLSPCEAIQQTYAPISITTATTTRIVAPSASNKTYICSLFLTSAAADNVAVVEGTGGTCGTGTAGVIGGTTAANGMNFAANSGVMLQAGGKVSVAHTAGTNVDLCLITSAATPLAGGIKYVQAP